MMYNSDNNKIEEKVNVGNKVIGNQEGDNNVTPLKQAVDLTKKISLNTVNDLNNKLLQKSIKKSNAKAKTKDERTNMMKFLDSSYKKVVNGVPGQKSIEELANDYLSKYDKETAITKLINYQTTKAAVSGFVTGFGGVITLPITIPANVASVLVFQMRMIAVIAKIRGYDLKSDQVQTFVYATLTGSSFADIVKKSGILVGNKLLFGVIKKIPGKVLTKINQKVGFRLITKFGTKGIINLGKSVPVAGALVGGTFDTITTRSIGKLAKKTFSDEGIDLGEGYILPKEEQKSE